MSDDDGGDGGDRDGAASAVSGRGGQAASGILLIGAGVAAFLRCRSAEHLEDGVLIVGLGLLAAWLVQRPHPTGRLLGSGLVLSGVGGAVVLVRLAGQPGYREPAILAGVALAAFLAAEIREGELRRAAGAVLAVAAVDALLAWGPRHVDAADLWRSLEQGWGYGVGLALYGVLTLAGVALPGGRR